MEQSERQWGAFESVLRFMMHNRKKDSSLPNDLEITDKSVRFHDLIEFNCTITSGFTIEDACRSIITQVWASGLEYEMIKSVENLLKTKE